MRRYWGYLLVPLLAVGWFSGQFPVAVLLAASIVALGFFLFVAPAWCGAVNRDGTLCRRNSTGLLIGCSLRQHKWQKIKLAILPKGWRELNRGLWVTPTQITITLAALATVGSTLIALATLLLQTSGVLSA